MEQAGLEKEEPEREDGVVGVLDWERLCVTEDLTLSGLSVLCLTVLPTHGIPAPGTALALSIPHWVETVQTQRLTLLVRSHHQGLRLSEDLLPLVDVPAGHHVAPHPRGVQDSEGVAGLVAVEVSVVLTAGSEATVRTCEVTRVSTEVTHWL